MPDTRPQPTLAEAVRGNWMFHRLIEPGPNVFGGPLPRPCVHCHVLTQELAHHFTEGDRESGPYAWTEPAHEACIERLAVEADAYAQGWEDHLRATRGDEAFDALEAHYAAETPPEAVA